MEFLFLAVGIVCGGLLMFERMRSRIGEERAKFNAEVQRSDVEVKRRVDEQVDSLRDETVEKTKKRVESQLREELVDEVKAKLSEKYDEQLKEEARARAEADAKRLLEEAQSERDMLLKNARVEAGDIKLEAKKEAEEDLKERRAQLDKLEERLSKREEGLDTRVDKLEQRDQELKARTRGIETSERELEERLRDIEQRNAEILTRLEDVARLSADEAKSQIIEQVVGEAKIEASRKVRAIEEEAIEEADKRAKKVISVAVQRYAGEFVAERSVNVVQLPSDDLKGRIIGREGRNIRALEAATGVDVIIDDTPEAVIVSGFDPVRREIARLTLEKLISDGRIHPSRIEEVVAKTEQEVSQKIKEAGEQAAFELGIHKLHPELLRTLGRLRYRTSYGQNMWSHSIEVGFLCGLMASELGVNVKVARRAGLLHDIGKALTHEQEGSHALIGAELAAKYGETEVVRNAIAAHHNEEPQNSVIAHLVIAADALSGARPGARREILETYIKRLEDLERISMDFEGVEKTYAIQAGREIRVMVQNSRVDDDQAFVLSREIARKIEDELTYPGQIKVTVIRETRAVDYAR